MADDEQRTENSTADSAPVEESTTEKQTDQVEEVETSSETEVTTEESGEVEATETDDSKQLSERAQKRFRDLANKVRDLSQERQEEQLPQDLAPPWMQQQEQSLVKPGQELTPEEYERHVMSKASSVVQLQMQNYQRQLEAQQKAQEASLKLEKETAEVESKFEELNPDSDSYNKNLSNRVIKIVERELNKNPYASVKEIVEDVMAIREDGRTKGASEVTSKTIKQAAESAVTPSSESSDSPKFEELSKEEMKKRLGYAN